MADEKATTQPGAASKAPPDLNDPNARYSRADAMAAMAARRRETVQEEMTPDDAKAFIANAPAKPAPKGDDEDADVDTPDVAATLSDIERRDAEARKSKEPKTDEPTLDPVKQVAKQTTIADEDLANYKVKLRINGVEQELTLDQVRAQAQKVGAADQYLRQTSEALERIQALEAKKAATEKPESPPATESKKDDPSFAQGAGDFTTRLFQGDEAGAAKALAEMLERLQPSQTTPALDMATLTRQVKYEYAIDEARSRFLQARPSVDVENSVTQMIANRCLVDELAERGVQSLYQLPIAQIGHVYDAAGRRMDALVPSANTTKSDVDPTRGTKKAAIDELPHAAVRAASTVPEPQDVSSVIDKMRQARPGALRA